MREEADPVPLKVAVRIRPRLHRDDKNGKDSFTDGQTKVVVSGYDPFTFSHAFGPDVTQQAVYNHSASQQVA